MTELQRTVYLTRFVTGREAIATEELIGKERMSGAVLVGEKQRLKAGVFPIPFVDGSGSGDAFAAGYIHGLLQGLDAEWCLRVAAALGASSVRAVGTTTGVFTRPECEAFLKEHTLRIERL